MKSLSRGKEKRIPIVRIKGCFVAMQWCYYVFSEDSGNTNFILTVLVADIGVLRGHRRGQHANGSQYFSDSPT